MFWLVAHLGHVAAPLTHASPPWGQPRGEWVFFFVYSHTNATSKRWHLWEIDLRFALNSTPGWIGRRVLPRGQAWRQNYVKVRGVDLHDAVGCTRVVGEADGPRAVDVRCCVVLDGVHVHCLRHVLHARPPPPSTFSAQSFLNPHSRARHCAPRSLPLPAACARRQTAPASSRQDTGRGGGGESTPGSVMISVPAVIGLRAAR